MPFDLDLTTDLISLTDFKTNTLEHTEAIDSGSALVLTVNGRSAYVVMSPSTFTRLQTACNELDLLRKLRVGIDEADREEGIPVDDVFETIRNEAHHDDKQKV